VKRIEVAGGLYCDALPGERWACLVPSQSCVLTHHGMIALDRGSMPLFLRLNPLDDLTFAGQSHDTPDTLLYRETHWTRVLPAACGANPVIFDHAGALHISDCSMGVNGWRHVDPITGKLISGDDTYAHPSGQISEYTDLGNGLAIGQSNVKEGCALWDGTHSRLIEPGGARFIRVSRDGDQVAIAMVKEHGEPSVLIWTTVTELLALPVLERPAPAPVRIPTIGRFLHPVLVAVYKDPTGRTKCPAEIVVNQYGQETNRPYIIADDSISVPCKGRCIGLMAEAKDPTTQVQLAKRFNDRLIWTWDSTTRPEIPSVLRPDRDVVNLELYLKDGEAPADAPVRWFANVQYVLRIWSGLVSVTPMLYTQWREDNSGELWTEQQVIDALEPLSRIVNLSDRIQLVLPFAYLRANGISAHPPFLEALNRIIAASPGLPEWVTAPPPAVYVTGGELLCLT